ncbi:MAG: phenylalanine--tRNA ligase subunit alpha, partial [Spartobacteria bacterium]
MEQQVEILRAEALALIASATDAAALEAARLIYLGKCGAITALSEGMRNVPKEDRPIFGKILNDLRSAVTGALEESQRRLLEAADSAAVGALDLTLPGTFPAPGTLHPL